VNAIPVIDIAPLVSGSPEQVHAVARALGHACRDVGLVIVVRDAGSVLVHAHDRRIDHLHLRIMTGGQRIHDPVDGRLHAERCAACWAASA
jgi:hypothetical protein